MDQIDGINLNIPETGRPRVVIIGGGFGGINTIKHLKNKGFQVVLFDKHNYHTFQPLLYQVATAGLEPDSIAGPMRKIFVGYEDFHFRMLKVLQIDPVANTVETMAGSLHYDYLVIANGARTNYFGNDQLRNFSFPLKFIPDALNLRSQFMQVFERANMTIDDEHRKSLLSFALVGGGPTGVEMAGALSELRKHVLPHDYPNIDFGDMKIYVIEGMKRLLPSMSEHAGAYAKKTLEKWGVIVKLDAMVESYDGETIKLKNKEEIKAGTAIWSAGVTGDVIPGLPQASVEKGRILTTSTCMVSGTNNIFAIGDIAYMKTDAYPKGLPGVAQPAIQMGKYVGKHLPDFHAGKSVKPFVYHDRGSLATIGRGKAVADLPKKLQFGGRIAWWIWLFIHITYLISFRNKLLVMTSWIWNYFSFDKGNRLIIRPFVPKNDEVMNKIMLVNESE